MPYSERTILNRYITWIIFFYYSCFLVGRPPTRILQQTVYGILHLCVIRILEGPILICPIALTCVQLLLQQLFLQEPYLFKCVWKASWTAFDGRCSRLPCIILNMIWPYPWTMNNVGLTLSMISKEMMYAYWELEWSFFKSRKPIVLTPPLPQMVALMFSLFHAINRRAEFGQ